MTPIPIDKPRPLLVSVSETARMLSLSNTTVLRLVNKGTLPSVRIGGSLRIPVDELLKWIKEKMEVAK